MRRRGRGRKTGAEVLAVAGLMVVRRGAHLLLLEASSISDVIGLREQVRLAPRRKHLGRAPVAY